MHSLEEVRKAINSLIARGQGQRYQDILSKPGLAVPMRKATHHTHEIINQPERAMEAPQYFDPEEAEGPFGGFKFMLDYDPLP